MRTQKFCCNDCKIRYFNGPGRKIYWKDPERARADSRAWYWKDPERARAYSRAFTARHRDRLNFKARQKRRLNIGFARERERQNRRKQRALRRAQFRLQTI